MRRRRRLHIVFGASAAGCVQQALVQQALDEDVVYPQATLNLGPLDPRVDDDFWRRVRAFDGTLVIWFSRRNAEEYCGLLWLLSALEERPLHVVDITDTHAEHLPEWHIRVSLFNPHEIVERGWISQARPLAVAERRRYLDEWRRLRAENAPIRIVGPRGLESKPLDWYDDALLWCIGTEWIRAGYVVGTVLGALANAACGDQFLLGRLLALVDDGTLHERLHDPEGLRSLHNCSVRREVPAAVRGARVHVTFSERAAVGLVVALREPVLALLDPYDHGPIDCTAEQRAAWFTARSTRVATSIATFWEQLERYDGELVIWTSYRDATTYCGLLAILARAPDDRIFVVEVDGRAPLAYVDGDERVAQRLLRQIRRVSPVEHERCRIEWNRMLDDNGVTRVVTASGLETVSPSCHDELVLSVVTEDWEYLRRLTYRAARLLNQSYPQQDATWFAESRIRALVDAGVLQARDDNEQGEPSGTLRIRR